MFALVSASFAQSQLDWLAAHDGALSQADYGRACAVDSSGNVIVAGRSYNPSTGFPPMPPTADFEIAKYTPAGTLAWAARVDLAGGDEFAFDAQCDALGNVYVCGYTWAGSNVEMALVKLDSSGVLQWTRTYGGAGGSSDFARAIAFDAQGNVLVCGSEYTAALDNDSIVRSYSPSGALNWSTSFDSGSNADDTLYALTVLAGGEILACGQFTNPTSGGANIGIAKLSSTGALLWQRNDDGGGNLVDGAIALTVLDAHLVALGGWRTSASGEDWHVSLYDHVAQSFSWSRTFNGSASFNERVRSVATSADGSLWVTGTASNLGTGLDIATRRYDASGALLSSDQWNNASVNLDEQSFKVLPASAGQVYVAGYTTLSTSPVLSYDIVAIQYDATGTRNWVATYSSPGAFDERIFDAELGPGNKLVGGGYTNSGPSGGFDYLALQIDLNSSPQSYCTAKVNSLGCSANFGFAGMPSASSTSGFVVTASPVRNQKAGLLFYSTFGATSAPFQGGFYCVQPPARRGPLLASGGATPPNDDCSGALGMDMNAFAHGLLGGAPAPELLTVGTAVHCQFWSRDPGASFNTNLSNALRYVVLP